jgi:F-type H+-transporting ATPase subunit delta
MISEKVAEAYAEALFQLASENDCLDETYCDLSSVSDIFDENPGFIDLLSSPTLSKEEKLSVLNKTFKDDGSILFDFLCLLTERNRIRCISQIKNDFRNFYNQKNGIEEVTVTSSIPLSEDERCRLIVKLQNKLSKRIKLTEKVDKSLIGGVRLKYGDTLIDNSVASRIENIAEELTQPAK